jgi:hypothetical protein
LDFLGLSARHAIARGALFLEAMRKSLFPVAALLSLAETSWADTFRVHYSLRGSGRDITVQAESSSEARRTVMDIFPGAVVTGVSRVKLTH